MPEIGRIALGLRNSPQRPKVLSAIAMGLAEEFSCHVIVLTDGKQQPDDEIIEMMNQGNYFVIVDNGDERGIHGGN